MKRILETWEINPDIKGWWISNFGNEEKERWRWITGYKGYYKISNFGRVLAMGKIRNRTNRYPGKHFLNPVSNQKGYLRVGLTNKHGVRKWKSIHSLVLETFVEFRPKGMEACHKDDNKENNFVGNLYWGTHKHNIRESWKNGKHDDRVYPQGEQCHQSKFTNKEVYKIRKFYSENKKYGIIIDLARRYNVSPVIMRDLLTEKTYKNII